MEDARYQYNKNVNKKSKNKLTPAERKKLNELRLKMSLRQEPRGMAKPDAKKGLYTKTK